MATWSILIVDDSSNARAQLRAVLEAKGARVIEAGNGQEGLWRAREHQLDLVFSDVHMPIMDGLKMVQELRALPGYATTPIFIYTSDVAEARAVEAKRAGANALIEKPARPDLLWRAVEKALYGLAPSSPKQPVSLVARPKK